MIEVVEASFNIALDEPDGAVPGPVDRVERGVHRDFHEVAGFFLADRQYAVADVLAAHAHHIAAPLTGVEQQRLRQPRLATDVVPFLELCDLGLRPGVDRASLRLR